MTYVDISQRPHGQRLARGITRLLRSLDYAVLTEFIPARGLRVDVIGLGPGGEIWIVECKSSRTDFISDRKWPGYLPWCDRFFWGVDADFPADLLPAETGMILADPYGAEIQRMGIQTKLAGARRSKITREFARTGAMRLQASSDPGAVSDAVF